MGKFSGYLLCSDFDGTFASQDLSFHEDNIKQTSYFIENGGHFTLATGRSIDSVFPYISDFEISSPAILFNGGAIYNYNSDEIIYKKNLDPIWKNYAKDILKKFPDLIIQALLEKKNFLFGNEQVLEMLLELEPDGNNEFVKSIDELPDNCIKIIFVGDSKLLLEVEEYVRVSNFNKAVFVKSADFLLEVMPTEVSKGKALEFLADHLGIKMSNTFAIGDFYNDVSMLKSAGFSAAVDNAPDEVKEAADITVGNHNEGAVAEFIKIIEKKLSNTSN